MNLNWQWRHWNFTLNHKQISKKQYKQGKIKYSFLLFFESCQPPLLFYFKTSKNGTVDFPDPSLQFIEQPTDRFRFRYKSEMAGTHGSLTGIKSDKSRKQTYPTVEVNNFFF